MTISNSRGSYSDCYDVMDKALEDSKGVRVEVDDLDAAIFFRMRLHNARKIDRRDNSKIYSEEPTHPMFNASIYDKLTVRIKRIEDQVWVYLEKSGINLGAVEGLSEVSSLEKPEAVGMASIPTTIRRPV